MRESRTYGSVRGACDETHVPTATRVISSSSPVVRRSCHRAAPPADATCSPRNRVERIGCYAGNSLGSAGVAFGRRSTRQGEHTAQPRQRDRSPARAPRRNLVRQIAVRFDEKTFRYRAFVLFERAFDPVHAIAVAIGHRGDDLVIAGSRMAKTHIRSPGHHLTNVELAHRAPPISATVVAPPHHFLAASAGTGTKGRRKTDHLLAWQRVEAAAADREAAAGDPNFNNGSA